MPRGQWQDGITGTLAAELSRRHRPVEFPARDRTPQTRLQHSDCGIS